MLNNVSNPLTLLVMAPATMGKTFCLRNINSFGKAVLINCDAKPLPFPQHTLKTVVPENSLQIFDLIAAVEESDTVDVGIIDTVTQLGADYVNQYVVDAEDTRAAWGEYKTFMERIMSAIKSSSKTWIIMAHEQSTLDEASGIVSRSAPFQGGFAKIGLEANFSTIIGCSDMTPSKLQDEFKNDHLTITEDEKFDDYKYVFMTRRTREARGVKYRAPFGFWERKELYVDNDIVPVLQRLHKYHNAGDAA